MVGETADPVLLSSRAGGRWLTAGALVLTAALLATQSFELKRSAVPKRISRWNSGSRKT